VLGGRVVGAASALALDWRRALGLFLWHASPATAPVESAVEAYVAALRAEEEDGGGGRVDRSIDRSIGATSSAADRSIDQQHLPRPVPPHARDPACILPDAARSSGGGASTASATDVQWELLQVHGGRARLDPDALGRLVRPAGYTRNPFDYAFSWQLLTALRAADVVSARDLAGEVDEAVGRAVEGALLQLHLLGGAAAARWSVYLLMTAVVAGADGDEEGDEDGYEHQQQQQHCAAAVREVLARTAGEWARDSASHAFFARLGVPRAWLHEAQAVYAGALRQPALQLVHLMAAGLWVEAHEVFVSTVAPSLFLAGEDEALKRASQRLAEHRGQIPGWATGGAIYAAFAEGRWSDLAMMVLDSAPPEEEKDSSSSWPVVRRRMIKTVLARDGGANALALDAADPCALALAAVAM